MVERDSHRFSVERPERKRPVGRHRDRWEGNIKIYLGDIGWTDMDWINVAQYRDQWRVLMSTVMNLHAPQNIGKFLSS
jgi:hypothetical protein